MPSGLTNLNIINVAPAREVTLELLSFSGGENKIGTDQELENNEAETIENWDAISLGGMIRSKGFENTAEGSASVEAATITGGGLDDATSGGTYSGSVSSVFEVEIDSEGTPDTFKWKKDSGSYTEGVAITGAAQTLSDGVTITFAATTGHTATDKWTIEAVNYVQDIDLVIEHKDSGGTELYAVIEGDLAIKDSTSLDQEDAGAFTSGLLCHGVSAGDKLWITNRTDNLQYKTVGNSIATPSDTPTASDRIYEHNFRLVAEGNASDTVEGSMAGKGNWAGASAWSAANNAWSITMPSATKGCVPGFPGGTDITVFTEHDTYVLYNIPNVVRRRVGNGIGCKAPYSVVKGNEGVFFLSDQPTLGVFLWNGSQYINLTQYHDFVDDINLSQRVFGAYKDQEYWITYNETGSGVTYPNRCKIYNAKFGRWKTRKISTDVSDNFGYPAIKKYSNNGLVYGSSQKDILYNMLTGTDDAGEDTQAKYLTKWFTSRDFRTASGQQFPIDNCRLKLISVAAQHKGDAGEWVFSWNADRGRHLGSQTFSLESGTEGDLINTTFEVNTSDIISFDESTDKKSETRTFNNSAVGEEIQFEILNNGTGLLPEIKKIKIKAIILDEV